MESAAYRWGTALRRPRANMVGMKRSEIALRVDRSDDGIEAIRWEADEAPVPGEQQAGAMLLALWDAETRNAMRIDLWTKRMTVQEMNEFVFQTLMSLADSYQGATRNKALAAELKLFAREFAERAVKYEAGSSPPPG
jgi:gliding motility-associated protein GldC